MALWCVDYDVDGHIPDAVRDELRANEYGCTVMRCMGNTWIKFPLWIHYTPEMVDELISKYGFKGRIREIVASGTLTEEYHAPIDALCHQLGVEPRGMYSQVFSSATIHKEEGQEAVVFMHEHKITLTVHIKNATSSVTDAGEMAMAYFVEQAERLVMAVHDIGG